MTALGAKQTQEARKKIQDQLIQEMADKKTGEYKYTKNEWSL